MEYTPAQNAVLDQIQAAEAQVADAAEKFLDHVENEHDYAPGSIEEMQAGMAMAETFYALEVAVEAMHHALVEGGEKL